MASVIKQVEQYIAAHHEEYVERLKAFLRIPSISTAPDAAADTRRAGAWVCELLQGCGVAAELVDTPKHPCVIGDSGPVNGGGPTVLLYGHYDVQPVGALPLWKTPPFEPEVRDGRIYARGAADDKGQVLTHLLALEAWKKVAGRLPVRVKLLIEGEEEIGSVNLEPLVRAQRDRLACDYVALSDTAKLDDDTPAITYGTRGLVYKEIRVYGPSADLHSGSFGGSVANPGNALARILAALKDDRQRVTIPGFYDDVAELGATERKQMDRLPFDEPAYLRSLGSAALVGEAGFSTLQRRWCRPTLDVNGLFGGYMGAGAATLIPAWVGAKVSMRIVPKQNPRKISEAFDAAVRKLAGADVRIEIDTHSLAAPYLCPIDSPGAQAAARAITAGTGRAPAFIREGGTLPILPMFKDILGADSLMIGFALPNCNAHSPNEFFVLEDFYAGIRTSAHFLQTLAEL
jgi:acetylornithine deacetylase/succinyl-diaminopimelate desuccinylase-like protein